MPQPPFFITYSAIGDCIRPHLSVVSPGGDTAGTSSLYSLVMGRGLFLGREVDPKTGDLGEPLELDPADLLTHGLIVGMTGSGKTGLAIALIEEVLRQGIPVLAIDPKGDLGNLLLLFDDLSPRSFAPWVDPDAARREGKDVSEAAADAAQAWRNGLAEWGLTGDDVGALRRCREATLYTPGSQAGVPLSILGSLCAPSFSFDSAEEDLRDEISGLVSGILGLVGVETDPLRSREHILLSHLIEAAWREGRSLTLEDLVGQVADPPLAKIGALPLESVFPKKDRQALMITLNNILASPSFESWREGRELDIESLLRTAEGRARLSIVSIAHLSDEERIFVVALLLDKVKTWMRRQGGTTELRALVYMDEIYGYFPPHPSNPPTKRPLLTLLKQARAQGVSVVLATQNPVDLDYKGLANMGTWAVGKLQTQQDRDRLEGGLIGVGVPAAQVGELLGATRKRVFLLHDVHRDRPSLLHTRWTLSYLRGPLTRDEISRLTPDREEHATRVTAAAEAAEQTGQESGEGPPAVPSPLKHRYVSVAGGERALPHLLVKYSVRFQGGEEASGLRAYALMEGSLDDLLESEPLILEENAVSAAAPPGMGFGTLPSYMATPGVAKAIDRLLKEQLPKKLETTLFFDPVTETPSRPGEDAEAFATRLRSSGRGSDEARLRERLERKKRELEAAERELSDRKGETWAAVGSAILQNIGLFTGRRRRISVTGVEGVFSKNRRENAAEAKVEELRAEVAELDQQLTSLVIVDPTRFEERGLAPSDVRIQALDLLWVS